MSPIINSPDFEPKKGLKKRKLKPSLAISKLSVEQQDMVWNVHLMSILQTARGEREGACP